MTDLIKIALLAILSLVLVLGTGAIVVGVYYMMFGMVSVTVVAGLIAAESIALAIAGAIVKVYA